MNEIKIKITLADDNITLDGENGDSTNGHA